MKLWACNEFDGMWTSGVGIVIAETKERALELFNKALDEAGLYNLKDIELLKEVDLSIEHAEILFNGEY